MKTETTKFISISISDIGDKLAEKLDTNQLYTYEDKEEIAEHLYGPESLKEKAQEKGVFFSEYEQDKLRAIEIEVNRKNAAYFRIVKF